MAEPFVFHFRRGDAGPEQMYLADIRAECGLCRHVQVQRYYHSTPLHSVTATKLHRLACNVVQKTEFDCPNCGSAVKPEHALSTAFTWAFADDAGLIRGFVSDARDEGSLRWQFVQQRRLDPQELPGWAADESEDVFDLVDDDRIEQALGRPLNPKAVIREVLLDWLADPDGGAVATIGPHMTLHAGDDLEEGYSLNDCIPHDLPTHRDSASLAGRLDGWLPAVDRTRVAITVDPQPAVEAIDRAFAVANLTADRTDDGWENLKTPRDAPYPRDLPLSAILRRAVYTGMTPGDAARLTAEEIVGSLLRVW